MSENKKTKQAFLWVRIFGIPFFTLFDILIFILLKGMHASPFELAVALSLQPVSGLLSPYWSAFIHRRQDLIKTNLLLANILRYLPFLLFPLFSNIWLFILSIGIYWTITKGMTPAWMELIKVNIAEKSREKLCSKGLNINYLGKLALPIFIGFLLDHYVNLWQNLFSFAALMGIISTFFIARLKSLSPPPLTKQTQTFTQFVKRPWKDSFALLKSNHNFLKFQMGFFLGGAGLIIMQVPMTTFFAHDLNLSYTTLNLAKSTMKGLGFILTSSFWVKRLRKIDLFSLSRQVIAFALIFPCLIALCSFYTNLIFLAYILYGVMQSGSELTWHMSGPIFAGKEQSSIYSTTSNLTMGIRGVIFPYLGSLLLLISTPYSIFAVGGTLILSSIILFSFFIKQNDRIKRVNLKKQYTQTI